MSQLGRMLDSSPLPSASTFTLTPPKERGKDSGEILLRATLTLGVVARGLRTADGGAQACGHL